MGAGSERRLQWPVLHAGSPPRAELRGPAFPQHAGPRYHGVRSIRRYARCADIHGGQAAGAVQTSQRLSKATKLLFRYSWTHDQIDQSTLKIDPLLIPLYSQPSQVGLFGINLVEDRRDNAADAHRGIYNSLDVSLASHAFGGNKNFARFLGRNSYYKKLVGNLILASNTEFGVIRPFSTDGVATSEYVPLPERFFGGGDSTIRGFPMNQAGPRDPDTGFPLGGNALLFHSTELRFPLIGDNIYGVVFHDMGNIYSSLGSISFSVHQNGLTDFNYMVHAAGFGIRYQTPLGPIWSTWRTALIRPLLMDFQALMISFFLAARLRRYRASAIFNTSFLLGRLFNMMKNQIVGRKPAESRLRAGLPAPLCLLLVVLCGVCAAGVVDRVAIVIGKQVVTESEVLDDLRLTEFIDNEPLDLGPAARRTAAEHLVDQALIRQDLEMTGYSEPPASESDTLLRKFRQSRFHSLAGYRAALGKYGITEEQLKQRLLWQLTAVRFVDFRFGSGHPKATRNPPTARRPTPRQQRRPTDGGLAKAGARRYEGGFPAGGIPMTRGRKIVAITAASLAGLAVIVFIAGI